MSPRAPSTEFEVWSKQGDLIAAHEHSVLLAAGVASGKTVAGAIRALNASYGWIGNQRVIPTPNWGMVTALTYSMLEDGPIEVFRTVAERFIDDFNETKKRAKMTNGSTVLFRSTEKIDRRRGSTLSWWWGDESAMYRPNVWHTMIARLREHGLFGYRWLTTSPKGRDWQWQLFERDAEQGFKMIRAATWENPFLREEYIKDLIYQYGGLDSDFARQEILGEFISHSGLIYNQFGDRHITRKVLEYYPQVEAGVDWGFRNPGVIEVGGIDVDGGIDILHEEYKKQRDIDGWIETALDLRDRYLITRFWCDPARPDYIAAFRAAGLNAVATDNRVLPGINQVKRMLARRGPGGLRIHESCVWLIKEMRDLYQWAKERGLILPEEPLKVHDHAADALRYLVMGVARPGAQGTMTLETPHAA
jgi:phage terminase large subunit-like protein